MKLFIWQRRGGYEVSSLGDKRFSALFAMMPDGRSLEMHYQCDCKSYQPGGTNWRLGKGKSPLDPTVDLWGEYLKLWRQWAILNKPLMKELYFLAKEKNYTLSDTFASTPINQAHALATILNEFCERFSEPTQE
jgi:hypothetical protein